MGTINFLIVSIHDATPFYMEGLKEITTWLDQHSVTPRCIKVIPNFLGKWNILEYKDFMDWLLDEKEKGHEIVQHGYAHTENKVHGGLFIRLRNHYITRFNSEFLKTGYEETKRIVEKGRDILNEGRINCSGFTSPTWFQSKEASRAIHDCGFKYHTSFSAIHDRENQKNIFAPAMGHYGIDSSLEYMTLIGNIMMRNTVFLCSRVVRIVLHPQHISNCRPLIQALSGIIRLIPKRKLITYTQSLEIKND
ncbi:MAG: DUF2334 domain-containing protein [Candidatus Aminicenantaceae bacterium]